jgi:hypothetical protein
VESKRPHVKQAETVRPEAPEGSGLNGTKTNPQPKYNLTLGPAIPLGSPSARVAGGTPKYLDRAEGMTSAEPVSRAEIEGLKKKREAAERRVQQLNNALQNLQELFNSQTKPDNLVAIKQNGTPVYARPEEAGKALFTTMEKDQFEMVEIRGEWVHARISGDSRGWIRRAQLEFSDDVATASAGGTKPVELFRITREESACSPETGDRCAAKP